MNAIEPDRFQGGDARLSYMRRIADTCRGKGQAKVIDSWSGVTGTQDTKHISFNDKFYQNFGRGRGYCTTELEVASILQYLCVHSENNVLIIADGYAYTVFAEIEDPAVVQKVRAEIESVLS